MDFFKSLLRWAPFSDPENALREALTFYASFDEGVDADFAIGDSKLYTLVTSKPELETRVGLPIAEKPLILVADAPFDRDHWTHVAITINGFNNPGTDAVARLYLNGELQGNVEGWEQQYSWDLESAQIRLGVNFVGDFDELSCFDRSLAPEEIETLYSLSKGIGSIFTEANL